MDKLTDWITKVLSVILIVLTAANVLDVTWQVFTRFILNNPSSFTEELAGFLLIWIGLLGASYALRTKSHLGIDILTYKLTGAKKQAVDVIIYSIVGLFALFVMVIGGTHLVKLTFTLKQISPATQIKMGYVYIVLPLTGVLFIYFCLYFIVQTLQRSGGEQSRHQVGTIE